MSEKRFIEGFPTLNHSKTFSSSSGPRSSHPAAFQVTWPALDRKGRWDEFDQRRKELEARVLKEAKEKALLIEKEAYEKGFAQGERDGLELAEKRLETALRQLQNLIVVLGEERKKLFEAYEKELVAMVLSIARRILRRELDRGEEIVVATLREAFEQVVDQGRVVIRLHPLDYLYLSNHPQRLPPGGEATGKIALVEDPSITRGGCLLETSFGEIDATFEGQFDQIASAVWEKVRALRENESGSNGGAGSDQDKGA